MVVRANFSHSASKSLMLVVVDEGESRSSKSAQHTGEAARDCADEMVVRVGVVGAARAGAVMPSSMTVTVLTVASATSCRTISVKMSSFVLFARPP